MSWSLGVWGEFVGTEGWQCPGWEWRPAATLCPAQGQKRGHEVTLLAPGTACPPQRLLSPSRGAGRALGALPRSCSPTGTGDTAVSIQFRPLRWPRWPRSGTEDPSPKRGPEQPLCSGIPAVPPGASRAGVGGTGDLWAAFGAGMSPPCSAESPQSPCSQQALPWLDFCLLPMERLQAGILLWLGRDGTFPAGL